MGDDRICKRDGQGKRRTQKERVREIIRREENKGREIQYNKKRKKRGRENK